MFIDITGTPPSRNFILRCQKQARLRQKKISSITIYSFVFAVMAAGFFIKALVTQQSIADTPNLLAAITFFAFGTLCAWLYSYLGILSPWVDFDASTVFDISDKRNAALLSELEQSSGDPFISRYQRAVLHERGFFINAEIWAMCDHIERQQAAYRNVTTLPPRWPNHCIQPTQSLPSRGTNHGQTRY